MRNITTEIKGNKLTITVDISKPTISGSPMSKSGKNKLVASTEGVVAVNGADGIKIGLNVMARE